MKYHPEQAVIQTVNFCNITCTICPLPVEKRHFMTLETAKRCVDALVEYPSVRKIEYAGGIGEPTLHPHLCEMIRYAKDAGHKCVGTITNGTTLRRLAEPLIGSQVDYIIVSLYGSDGEHHSQYQSSRLEVVEDNIRRLLDVKTERNADTAVILRYSPFDPSDSDVEAFRLKWQDYPVRISSGVLHNARDGIITTLFSNNVNCYCPTKEVVFDTHGQVVSCCINSENLPRFPSINTASLESIYEGLAFEQWREKRLQLECRTCSGLRPPERADDILSEPDPYFSDL